MNWSTRFSSWLALRDRRRKLAALDNDDADRAGMGTAYGLDASFDANVDMLAPYAAEAAPNAGAPASLASALQSRLVRRSGL